MKKIALLSLLFPIIFISGCKGDHIYAVENYSQGVAICVSGGVMLTINDGHSTDLEALQLLQQGGAHCDKYNSR